MALQYDNPVWTNEFTDALAVNPGISDTTVAAISTLLDLENADSVVVAGWDGVAADVTVPAGKEADVVAIAVAGATATTLALPDSVSDAKAIIIESDADVTLAVGTVADTNARVIVGGNGNDTLTVAGNGNTTLDGGDGNDTLATGNGNNVVIGGFGDDTITTGTGSDTIVTGVDHDTINTGAGRDTVQVEGASTAFDVTVSGSSLVLTGTGANVANTVSIQNAEFLTFNNGDTLAIASTDAQAGALRLFEGLLGRDADNGGAEAFTAAIDNGASLTAVTKSFLASTEYQNNLNDDFVEGLYQSLLGRAADTSGEAAWLNQLANGVSRADVVAGIHASAEGQAAATTDNEFVSALYENGLGRAAEQGGLDTWISALTAGASRADVANLILSSAEAAGKANSDFVDSLYSNALGRDANADAAGKASWMTALEHGATQADIAIGIVGSPEAQDHITNVVVVHGAV